MTDDVTTIEDRLRSCLHSRADGVTSRPDTGDVRRRVRARRQRRTAGLSMGCAVLVSAVVAIAAAGPRGQAVSTTPAADPGTPGALSPPRLLFDGWTVVGYYETARPAGALRAVAVYRGPDGRLLTVSTGDAAFDAGGERPANVDHPGAVEVTGPRTVVGWRPVPRTTVVVEGRDLPTGVVLAAARSVEVSADRSTVSVGAVPPGLEAVPLPASTVDHVSQRMRKGDQELEVNMYAGGQAALESRVDDGGAAVTVRGTDGSLVRYGSGRFRVGLLQGWWVWELDGSPFPSEDDFVETVDAARVVDEQAWRDAVASTVITPDRWAAEVGRLRADIPLPPGGSWDALAAEQVSASRYNANVRIVGHAVCAWAAHWLDATEAGSRRKAVDTLAGSGAWTAVREMAGEGAYGRVVTMFAGTMRTGTPLEVRTAAVRGFGCELPGEIGPP